MLEKFDHIKQLVESNKSELVLTVGVILISLTSFAAGRLTAPGFDKQQITVEYLAPASAQSAFQHITGGKETQEFAHRTEGVYVASKNSSKYHFPHCIGAKRIAEHNKIWFNSKEEAEILGYQPASNCPGL